MALERIFVWTCDTCGKRVEKHDYGLPPGWYYVKTIGKVPHVCEECLPKLPAGTQVGRN
jgi:hypothetical protein